MVIVKRLEFETKYPKVNFFNMTEQLKSLVKDAGIKNGTITVQSLHTTCAVFFEEYVHDEDYKGHDYLQIDLLKCLRSVFPDQTEYDDFYKYPGPEHLNQPGIETRLEYLGVTMNGPAHLKATIVGASETFVIEETELLTGPYGSIWFVDFDYNRPRKRTCSVCIMGE